jgi:Arc/MetJ-type ribon-helix-helix transcriptional regulator
METLQICLTEEQLIGLRTLERKGVYPNRSEAVRDAVRQLLERYEKKSVTKGKMKIKRR